MLRVRADCNQRLNDINSFFWFVLVFVLFFVVLFCFVGGGGGGEGRGLSFISNRINRREHREYQVRKRTSQ